MSLVSKIYLSLVSCLLLVSCARAAEGELGQVFERAEDIKQFEPVQAVPQITPGPGPIAPPMPVQEIEIVKPYTPKTTVEQPPVPPPGPTPPMVEEAQIVPPEQTLQVPGRRARRGTTKDTKFPTAEQQELAETGKLETGAGLPQITLTPPEVAPRPPIEYKPFTPEEAPLAQAKPNVALRVQNAVDEAQGTIAQAVGNINKEFEDNKNNLEQQMKTTAQDAQNYLDQMYPGNETRRLDAQVELSKLDDAYKNIENVYEQMAKKNIEYETYDAQKTMLDKLQASDPEAAAQFQKRIGATSEQLAAKSSNLYKEIIKLRQQPTLMQEKLAKDMESSWLMQGIARREAVGKVAKELLTKGKVTAKPEIMPHEAPSEETSLALEQRAETVELPKPEPSKISIEQARVAEKAEIQPVKEETAPPPTKEELTAAEQKRIDELFGEEFAKQGAEEFDFEAEFADIQTLADKKDVLGSGISDLDSLLNELTEEKNTKVKNDLVPVLQEVKKEVVASHAQLQDTANDMEEYLRGLREQQSPLGAEAKAKLAAEGARLVEPGEYVPTEMTPEQREAAFKKAPEKSVAQMMKERPKGPGRAPTRAALQKGKVGAQVAESIPVRTGQIAQKAADLNKALQKTSDALQETSNKIAVLEKAAPVASKSIYQRVKARIDAIIAKIKSIFIKQRVTPSSDVYVMQQSLLKSAADLDKGLAGQTQKIAFKITPLSVTGNVDAIKENTINALGPVQKEITDLTQARGGIAYSAMTPAGRAAEDARFGDVQKLQSYYTQIRDITIKRELTDTDKSAVLALQRKIDSSQNRSVLDQLNKELEASKTKADDAVQQANSQVTKAKKAVTKVQNQAQKSESDIVQARFTLAQAQKQQAMAKAQASLVGYQKALRDYEPFYQDTKTDIRYDAGRQKQWNALNAARTKAYADAQAGYAASLQELDRSTDVALSRLKKAEDDAHNAALKFGDSSTEYQTAQQVLNAARDSTNGITAQAKRISDYTKALQSVAAAQEKYQNELAALLKQSPGKTEAELLTSSADLQKMAQAVQGERSKADTMLKKVQEGSTAIHAANVVAKNKPPLEIKKVGAAQAQANIQAQVRGVEKRYDRLISN